MDVQIETIATDSCSLNYLKFGQGARTLVILPGLSVQSVMPMADAVARDYQALADDFTIYLIEPRQDPTAGYSITQMAQDAEAAIRALGLERVYLYGVSQGGMCAMQIALNAPDLVEKLALCSTAARVTESQYQIVEEWIELAERGDAEGLYLAFGEALYPDRVLKVMRGLLRNSAKEVTADDLQRFIVLAQAMPNHDIADSLGELACPVLVLGSTDDKIFKEDAFALFREKLGMHPDFEEYLYDGYGHAVYDLAPDIKQRLHAWFLM